MRTGARELQITLTARHKERGDPIPMCGVPHHSAANYIARLVRKGIASPFVNRPKTRPKPEACQARSGGVVTPGTPIDPQLLEARESVFSRGRVQLW